MKRNKFQHIAHDPEKKGVTDLLATLRLPLGKAARRAVVMEKVKRRRNRHQRHQSKAALRQIE